MTPEEYFDVFSLTWSLVVIRGHLRVLLDKIRAISLGDDLGFQFNGHGR